MLNLGHKKLHVYQISLSLVKEVYRLTKDFPPDECYGLVTQLRRAAVSVCSNIAEGASRRTAAERKRFYEISRGSSVEIDTQLEIALILQFIKDDQIKDLKNYLESVFRMISKMIENTK